MVRLIKSHVNRIWRSRLKVFLVYLEQCTITFLTTNEIHIITQSIFMTFSRACTHTHTYFTMYVRLQSDVFISFLCASFFISLSREQRFFVVDSLLLFSPSFRAYPLKGCYSNWWDKGEREKNGIHCIYVCVCKRLRERERERETVPLQIVREKNGDNDYIYTLLSTSGFCPMYFPSKYICWMRATECCQW